jgi:hypothetical protein
MGLAASPPADAYDSGLARLASMTQRCAVRLDSDRQQAPPRTHRVSAQGWCGALAGLRARSRPLVVWLEVNLSTPFAAAAFG